MNDEVERQEQRKRDTEKNLLDGVAGCLIPL